MLARLAPPLLIVVALALALLGRAWGTTAEPLWLDEAYSAYAADRDLTFLWTVVPSYETHPPFYYTLLHFWGQLFGDSLLARRALGIACGVGTVALIGVAAHGVARLASADLAARRWAAAVAMLVAAAHPTLTEMSREVRPYGPLMLAYAAAIVALIGLMIDRAERRPPRTWCYLLFFLAEAVLCWLHNLGPLYAFALSLSLLIVLLPAGRSEWRWIIGGHVALSLLYLPAFLILLDQAPTWIASTWLRFGWAGLGERLRALYGVVDPLTATAAVLLAAAGAMLLWRRNWRLAAALLLLAILPVALAILISAAVTPVFIIRIFAAVGVPAVLLASMPALLPGRWRLPALAVLAAVVVAMGLHVMAMRQGRPMQDWHRVVRWLAPKCRPGDVIWAYPNEGALPFSYAAKDLGLHLPVRQIPKAVPALGVGGFNPTGSRGVVSLYPDQIASLARSAEARQARTIWLLRMGPLAYDKGDGLYRALLPGRRVVARATAGPMDLVGLRKLTSVGPSSSPRP